MAIADGRNGPNCFQGEADIPKMSAQAVVLLQRKQIDKVSYRAVAIASRVDNCSKSSILLSVGKPQLYKIPPCCTGNNSRRVKGSDLETGMYKKQSIINHEISANLKKVVILIQSYRVTGRYLNEIPTA